MASHKTSQEAIFIEDLKSIGVDDSIMNEVLEIHRNNPDLVPYECKRKYNMMKNEEKLKSLNIMTLKPTKPRPQKRMWTPKPKPSVPLEPSRKSARIAGIKPVQYDPDAVLETWKPAKKVYKRPSLSFEEIYDIASDSAAPILDQLKKDSGESRKKTHFKNVLGINSDLKRLSMDQNHISKICKSRITAISVHSGSKLLVAGGSNHGEVGLFMPGDNKVTVRLEPHDDIVGCSRFSGNKLYTCSYDGSARMFDATTLQFDQIYYDNEVVFRSMYLKDQEEVLLAGADGRVVKVDCRAGTKISGYPDKGIPQDFGSLWGVHGNKFDENYFVTASNNHDVVVWDVRNNKAPVAVNSSHCKTVSSAYFDPVKGHKILTVGYDNQINIFDFADKTKLTTSSSLYHYNETGRWLSKFQAKWHPASEDIFVVGSMAKPQRRIEIFNSDGKMELSLSNENMNSIQSLVEFHPTSNAVIGANASGYCYVFNEL